MKIKKENAAICISIFALLVSIGVLYVNWKDFLVKNRPFIKITPITFENTRKFYKIKKISETTYAVSFKFKMENMGPVPANNIRVDHVVDAWIKGFSEKDIKGETIKQSLVKLKDSNVIEFLEIPMEQIDDEEMNKFFEELKTKDITYFPLYRKWKSLSLFPGNSFEYISGVEVSGKDAGWFLENFDKMRNFKIEIKIIYRGILPEIGKPYYSVYKALFEKGQMIPYETKSY